MHIIGLGTATLILRNFVDDKLCPYCAELYKSVTSRTLIDTNQAYKTVTRKDSHSGYSGANHYTATTYRDEQIIVERNTYNVITSCAHCNAVYKSITETSDIEL